MKTKILNFLRLGIFAFAIMAAYAFTQPIDPNQPKYGFDGNQWHNVTGQMPGQGVYSCDLPLTDICTRTGEGEGFDQVEPGVFIKN
ncbi:hypothetical protein [Aquiflexum sp.]|uniref:hypothetical protein n=1 Tax=Aquiflexum sp. TaxID=1872584 RepID=UPI0035943244